MNLDSESVCRPPNPSEPYVFEASSIGCEANSRLRGCEGEAVVHGVFDGAINVLLSNGLVSLVPEGQERGPLNVALRLPAGRQRMSWLGIRTGDRVALKDSGLELAGRHLVLFGSAGIYSPRQKFAAPLLGKGQIASNLDAVTKTALVRGNKAGLGGLLALVRPGAAKVKAGDLNIFARAALPRIVRLEQAFCSDEETALTEAVAELVGLGPGLTPSSDDMLAGLVLLCALYAKNHGIARRATLVVARAAAAQPHGRTTVLSEEFLRQAALGRGNERVMRLCAALLTEGASSAERETHRVLAIGETSGTDVVLGIVLGAMFCLGERSGLASRGFE